MPTIFLSHTSIDKPFVEKLAGDLERLGVRVWYDKYEIKVGESILWKIDQGIRESEYLGLVISKEAWESEWVKTEIAAAWQKQVQQKGHFVLPIYYRECEIPLFLSGIKYADFRNDYQAGLKDLAQVFGIKELDVITQDNWRAFAKGRKDQWKAFRDKEFERLITRVCALARTYDSAYGWAKARIPILLSSAVGFPLKSRWPSPCVWIRPEPMPIWRLTPRNTTPTALPKAVIKPSLAARSTRWKSIYARGWKTL